ncbi:hypothetical protein BAE44_0012403 [Dichanthelium oligosanthes]|uniref:SIAH-type domain-containing protein n=1 Tax=Dichanthelium oligosanthes TaxID=888268 RepID=A0A1E5VN82_9POAL|nr:hypothetical protein BAE44_0012403 [Dichanthelium oligosanthes]
MRWDDSIPENRDDHVPSLLDSQPNAPVYNLDMRRSGCCTCPSHGGDGDGGDGDGDGAVSAYAHCPGLRPLLRQPPQYGCERFIPYFRSDEHRDACGHAPCHCPEPGCYLVCSPRELAAHLTGEHSWPADEIAYGTARMFTLPMPVRHLRLLYGDDAFVFMVAAAPLGNGTAVSMVIVRANSPAHP